MQEILENWSKFLDLLEKQFPAVTFDLWVKTLKPIAFNEGCIIISATNSAAKSFIVKNHLNLLDYTLKECFKNYANFKLLDEKETDDFLKNVKENKEPEKSTEIIEPIVVQNQKPSFHKKFTFSNFVVGKSNQFVYAAAKAVAENPGTKYNPLFIYGGVGLGKTHILYSIANELQSNSQNLNIVAISCEKFTNDYVESLRGNNVNKFRAKYRNVDVLLIDDIQFLVNKTSTQEEFFHTFNDLYQNNKQIVLTSDRNPKELTTLEERLKSRFLSGLIQDIQSPEYETRLAILEKKVEIEQYRITKDALIYIAEKIDTNIRELEGFLEKVCFHAPLLNKSEADISDVQEALNEKITYNKAELTADKVCEMVCSYYGISEESLKGKKRSKEYVEPRQMAVYLICELMPDLPLTSIGLVFGGRDHTTIIHSRDKIEQNIKLNTKIKKQHSDIKTMVCESV